MRKRKTGVKKMLRRGDPAIIAGMTGFATRTVRGMLKGEIRMHPLVKEAVDQLIEARRQKIYESLTNQLK